MPSLRRQLSVTEVARARLLFADALEYDRIVVVTGSPLGLYCARTLGNTVFLHRNSLGSDGKLTARGTNTLMHELTHAWQYQHAGWRYVPHSLWSQLQATIATGTRQAAYDWRAALTRNEPWVRWNPEQQAQAVQRYDACLQARVRGSLGTGEAADLHALEPVLAWVWRGIVR